MHPTILGTICYTLSPVESELIMPHRTKHWSPEEDEQLRELVADGENRSLIASQLEHSVSDTEKRMHILKLDAKLRHGR